MMLVMGIGSKEQKQARTPPTGEVFAMHPSRAIYSQRAWHKLKSTIEQYGGNVETLDSNFFMQASRDPVFVRDPGVILADEQLEKTTYLLPAHKDPKGHVTKDDMLAHSFWHEGNTIAKRLQKRPPDDKPVEITHCLGTLEGGNVVIDPKSKTIFVGITNVEAIKNSDTRTPPEEEKERCSQSIQRACEALSKLVASDAMRLKDGSQYKVVQIAIPDEHALDFYHLDGCLGILPTGQAVVCSSVLSKTGKLDIERRIGRDNIIEISKEEAEKGATNFITVGNHVITPFASDRLKDWFKEKGYETIDPPSQGLKEGSWMFAKMGSVRCATLKLTPDRGFAPEVQKEPVREAAMAL